MNEIVDNLKEEKEQIEFKLQKFENLIKCQKLEIESKSNLLKQYELVNKYKILSYFINISLKFINIENSRCK
jgi:hypothetical protein